MSAFTRERLFDDFKLGECFTTDGMTMTEAAIIDFAQSFDPQPFHLDVEAAKSSPYGGLIASRLPTFALGLCPFFHTPIIHKAFLGSPRVDERRWTPPVRAGHPPRAEAPGTGEDRGRGHGDGPIGLQARPRHLAHALCGDESER